MAMEIVSKELHRHAVPIVMLLLGISLISAACFGYYSQIGLSGGARLARGLVTQAVYITPGTNGLGSISIGTDEPRASVSQAANLGQATRYSIIFADN